MATMVEQPYEHDVQSHGTPMIPSVSNPKLGTVPVQSVDGSSVPKVEKYTITLDFAANAAFIEQSLPITGLMKHVVFVTPDLEGTDTAELIFQDATDGYTLYASGEKNESTTTEIDKDLILTGDMNIRIETSGDQTANREFIVKIYYLG